MKIFKSVLFFSILFIFQSCIKDDFVDDMIDPVLIITTPLDSMGLNTDFQFEKRFLNNIGNQVVAEAIWTSSNPAVISITDSGLATANQVGTATIKASFNDGNAVFMDSTIVSVGEATVINTEVISGSIRTTSSYVLRGDFTYEESMGGVLLSFEDNYQASSALPGLFIYLSNNANSIANAHEIGAVRTFNGAHEYVIPDIGIMDYQFIVYFCKPFNIKVGDGTF